MSEKLKQCPFCGGKRVSIYMARDWRRRVAICNCGVEGPSKKTNQLAIKAWNRRS